MAGLKGPDLTKRVVKLSRAIESATVDTLKRSADVAKTQHLQVMRPHSGGDLRLSGVGRVKGRPGNRKIGVKYDLKKTRPPSAVVKATGPVHLIANDTAGRVIRSAYSKGRSRRGFIGPTFAGQFSGDRRAVLNVPGIGFRRSVRHPGTRGKNTWNLGLEKARGPVERSMRKRTTTVIKKGMQP